MMALIQKDKEGSKQLQKFIASGEDKGTITLSNGMEVTVTVEGEGSYK